MGQKKREQAFRRWEVEAFGNRRAREGSDSHFARCYALAWAIDRSACIAAQGLKRAFRCTPDYGLQPAL